jgi:hypothetical protein
MESNVMFLDCPAYLDNAGLVRCGLPAEVEYRYLVNSSDGPLESAKIRCPLGHWFNAPIEYLTWKKTPMRSGLTTRASRNGLYRRCDQETLASDGFDNTPPGRIGIYSASRQQRDECWRHGDVRLVPGRPGSRASGSHRHIGRCPTSQA